MEFIDHLKYSLDCSSEVNPFGKDNDRFTLTEEGTEKFYSERMSEAYRSPD